MYGCWFFWYVDQGFSWDQTNTAKGPRVNLRMSLPLKSCALFVLVSYFQTTCWCDFSENQRKWQDYVHHQATWFVAINHSSRFSKPQTCLHWTVEMESVQSDTVFLVGKCQWKGWIKRTAIYVLEALEVLWYRSRRRHILESLWQRCQGLWKLWRVNKLECPLPARRISFSICLGVVFGDSLIFDCSESSTAVLGIRSSLTGFFDCFLYYCIAHGLNQRRLTQISGCIAHLERKTSLLFLKFRDDLDPNFFGSSFWRL